MQLPEYLRRTIERQAQGLPLSGISQAAAGLSASYRGSAQQAVSSDLDRIAYLVTRFPATYAAAHVVMLDARERLGAPIESILDLGAGPGTAAHAALDVFPGARKVTLVEQDPRWIDLGKSLCAECPHAALRAAEWQTLDLNGLDSLPAHDLVLLSYVAGELDEARLWSVLKVAWDAARCALAIIEPGTPRAFSRIRFLREVLLRGGAHIVGPCPHEECCPMVFAASRKASGQVWAPMVENDWCHFAQRVERTSLHRRSKGGSLGYEDEKYSYVAVSRQPVRLPAARIVRHPIHSSGCVVLDLCTKNGLRAEALSRKDKASFRRARKALWGGTWQSPSDQQNAFGKSLEGGSLREKTPVHPRPVRMATLPLAAGISPLRKASDKGVLDKSK